jgi:RNA polymerase sigma-70 factor (ECF subfamily)
MDLVFGVCMKYLKHPQDSEDASIAIFEQLVVKLRSHQVSNFRSWLYVLTKNHCLLEIRKAKRTLTNDSESAFMHLSEEAHPDDEYIRQHMENGLMDCIEKLPTRQKQTVELFYFESMSYEEIALHMGVKKEKIRSYIQNGRRNLKNCMMKKMNDSGE